ncbi:uncharacterized protein LOC100377826 [Saccoglossus kowalevskii]|uniref:Flavin-containing monooxygenase n=1 Tax=Saccoglossus kowalevskii TaxID=10224 RepID=A0ABM0GR07_SACKO|nr:PREDICTED: flavin-containing monooxygenase FMO GS-OX-like 4-like [Saccoglossus kowalevskii]
MAGDASKILQVAVIGAGAAGLCAARHLASKPHLFQPHVFEKEEQVGGTWIYTEDVEKNKYGFTVHSSMYKNLKTNLPKEVMAFPDFPFDKTLPSFLTHQQVLQYLKDYAQHFDLNKFIKFKTCVDHIKPVITSSKENQVIWDVGFRGIEQSSDDIETQQFDAVIVCNGHYAEPQIPNIQGMSSFHGNIVHSHHYRHPEDYKDKNIVLLGAGASGIDVALDIAPCARRVILSHNKNPLVSALPENMSQAPGIKYLKDNKVIFKNDQEEEIDVLMLCTGYKYSFPFLSPECNVQVIDSRVTSLYKHAIHTQFPYLSFIGICSVICPFPQFDCQALFIMSILDGSQQLPSRHEMEKDIEKDYNWRLNDLQFPNRYAHRMSNMQWDYNDQLCMMAKVKPISRVVPSIYDAVHHHRVNHLMGYKTDEYEITGPDTWRKIEPNK